MALHYVVADARDKRPLAADYLIAPATAADVAAARSEPWLTLGHVPGRAGLLVVDIDRDPAAYREEVIDSLGPPLCEVRTRRGLHLYYRCHDAIGNRTWAGGEIRCTAGYALLWDEAAVLAALENIADAEPVDATAWPLAGSAGAGNADRTARPGQTRHVLAALKALPCAELSYDDWLYVGFGLHWGEAHNAVEDGLRIWMEWSATDPRRFRFGECAYKWRGFDAEKMPRRRTLATLFWLAKQHGWQRRRDGQRQQRPAAAAHAHPHLNARQLETHSILAAIAKGRPGRRTVSVLHQVLADHHKVSRKTVVRDFAHMKACGYLRIVGRKVVREADGGFALPVYRPIDPDRERWLQLAQANARPPDRDGPVVRMAGEVWDILLPIPGVSAYPRLVRRAGDSGEPPRAPP